jgi:tetratricopeptide (TPR) repeat protein
MVPTRFVLAGSLALVLGCASAPAPHPRALANNELCALELTRGNLQQAEVFCDLGLEFSPQYSDLWANKGLIAMGWGKKDLAKSHLIKAIRLNQDQLQAYVALGRIYLEEGSYGQAHDNYQRALKVNPDDLGARYNLGLTLFRMNKLELARKEWLTLLAVRPDVADAHHGLGIIAHRLGDKDQALDSFRRAVQLNPSNHVYWHDVGALLMELSRYKEAREAFAQCVALDQTEPRCVQRVAEAQRMAALVETGLQEGLSPPDASAPELLMLARELRKKGLLEKEEQTYKQCLKADGRYAPCHWGLFELYSEARKRESAQIACKNFLKYGSVEEFPHQMKACEKYLASPAQ